MSTIGSDPRLNLPSVPLNDRLGVADLQGGDAAGLQDAELAALADAEPALALSDSADLDIEDIGGGLFEDNEQLQFSLGGLSLPDAIADGVDSVNAALFGAEDPAL